MSASFSVTTAPNPPFNCPICLEELQESEDIVFHENGNQHPLHKNCIRQWTRNNPTCPICRTAVDFQSLFSVKENAITSFKHSIKMTTKAVLIGATLGIINGKGTFIFSQENSFTQVMITIMMLAGTVLGAGTTFVTTENNACHAAEAYKNIISRLKYIPNSSPLTKRILNVARHVMAMLIASSIVLIGVYTYSQIFLFIANENLDKTMMPQMIKLQNRLCVALGVITSLTIATAYE